MKRILSMALALMMVIALLGTALADDAHCYEPYEETVVLTTGKAMATNPNFLEGDSQADNYLIRAIRDELNIDIQLLWEVDDYEEKIALQIAASDLPDVFRTPNYLTYLSLVENELLADLSEAWATYATDIMYDTAATYETSWVDALTDADGHLYCIASPNYYYDGCAQMWLRDDWMSALGLSAPTTTEELHDLLVAFKENYGSVLELQKDPTAAYGACYSAWGILAGLNAYPRVWIDGADGKVVYGTVTDEMKEGVKLLHDWYEEGLIDPEFPTLDGSAVAAKFNMGETGIVFGPWWTSFQLGDSTKLDGAEVTPYNIPADKDGYINLLSPTLYGSQMVVSAKCEHPEAFIKAWCVQFDIYNFRFSCPFAEKYAEINTEARNGNIAWSALFPFNVNSVSSSSLLLTQGVCADLIENGSFTGEEADPTTYTESRKSVATAAAEWYKGNTENVNGWVYLKGYYEGCGLFLAEGTRLIQQQFGQTTETMADVWASLRTLEDTTIMGMIVGEIDIDAGWDSFVSQWYAQGGDIVTEEVNELCGR